MFKIYYSLSTPDVNSRRTLNVLIMGYFVYATDVKKDTLLDKIISQYWMTPEY